MITSIAISNTYGIDQLEANLGSVVVIEGKNGAGKTSILAAILKMIEGGHDPGILRRYCEKCNRTAPEGERCECGGEIVTADKARVEIRLDNGCRFSYTCTEKTYKLEGWNSTGAAVKAPKTALEEMISLDRVSPGEILKIDASTKPGMRELRDRLQHLIPLTFEPSDLPAGSTEGERDSIAIATRAIESVASEARARTLDLAGFDRACTVVRETRQRINRDRSEKDKTVAALQGKVDGAPDDVGLQLDAAREVLARERETLKVELERLASEERAAKAAERQRLSETIAEIRAKAEAEIAAASAASKTKEEEITEKTRGVAETMRPAFEMRISSYTADVARLETLQRGFIEAEQTRRTRDEFSTKARQLAHESVRYDRAIELLENLRVEKLRNLPIQGLEVGADFVRVDGVDWEKLNTAKRMWLCVRICAHLSKGAQKILFLDHGEAFDPDTYAEVKEAIENAGFQLILARVSDAPKVKIAA